MDPYTFFFLLFSLLMCIIILAIPVSLSFFIYRLIKSNSKVKALPFISIIPIIVFGYFIYTAVYPTKKFYKSEFEHVTKQQFPASANFLYKSASYPGFHGDYHSTQIIEVDTSYFQQLPKKLKKNGLKKGATNRGSRMIEKAEQKVEYLKSLSPSEEYYFDFEDSYYSVSFLSDETTLIIYRSEI